MADGEYRLAKPMCFGDGCTRTAFARGMCKTHYSRWRIHGDCNKVALRRLPEKCEVAGCDQTPRMRWKKGKAVCNAHWQCLYRYGSETPPPTAPRDPLPFCVVHKCRSGVRSSGSPYCEKHYGRARRGVELAGERTPMHRYITKSGYVMVIRVGHPMARNRGQVYEHRLVAYDAHGGECPGCYWCGKGLEWQAAVVDHLNEDKQDNRPENLLVCCNNCNRARGAILPFVAGMRSEAVGTFIDAIHAYRAAHHDGDKQRQEQRRR